MTKSMQKIRSKNIAKIVFQKTITKPLIHINYIVLLFIKNVWTPIYKKKHQLFSLDNFFKASFLFIASQHDWEADYYFRDSFDHTYSDGQLVDTPYGPRSRMTSSMTPRMQRLQNTKMTNVQAAAVAASVAAVSVNNYSPTPRSRAASRSTSRVRITPVRSKNVRIIRILVPAIIVTVTVLFVVIVLVFETDSNIFEGLRKTPQMVAIRSHYYTPIRDFLKQKFNLF